MENKLKRRDFLKTCAALGIGGTILPAGCWFSKTPDIKKKLIILGIDGMDVHLSSVYMQQGLLPNFKRLFEKGSMRSIHTSMPPQSPVAWSNFSVGSSPAVHGIYDFIHRDPKTMIPYLSTSRVSPPDKTIGIAGYKIPLTGGETKNLMKGRPFWDYLADRDIPTTIFKMPANFPCENDKVRMVSGMGTPDLRGGYGSYTLFTTTPEQFEKDITGGRIIPVQFNGQEVQTYLPGPVNTLKQDSPPTNIPVQIWRDMRSPVVRLLVQDKEFILKNGEWTGWFQISFPMLDPVYDVKGICKIYIKDVYPEFNMYVSPINIDPSNPALPVVSSESYGKDLVENTGFFYTQGMPEDTKALSEGALNEDEYLDLAMQIIRERGRLLDYELDRFKKLDTGMLFFYYSSLDQDTHMYWRTVDKAHPMYSEELGKNYGNTLKKLYVEMDKALGKVLDQNDINDPDFTLMVMSDHGFAPFRRQVNLNNWLYENGYLILSNTTEIENRGYLENVKWDRTGAYSVGINAVYLNLRDREQYGIVLQSQAESIRNDIQKDLLNLVDPTTGQKAVSRVHIIPDEERQKNPHAPDLLIGWNYGYRSSWSGILGGFSNEIFADNLDKWSGDHCIDPALVPAVLFTNKKVNHPNPSLYDITATVLEEFSITPGKEMKGRSLFTA